MLANVEPSSASAIAILVVCLLLVFTFETTNGFHDTANAVATVIYTNSLQPTVAVIWSGMMNFVGVLVGGIAVAYALIELLPPDVLSPPNGSPAVTMLVALFASACFWNIATWWFGIPNSSSHCIIGALIGVSIGNALLISRPLDVSVDWSQVWSVLRALAVSPVLGLVLAGGLYLTISTLFRTGALFQQTTEDWPASMRVRALLILTCGAVSFSHGTNDGQKSIGLIMLTFIGLFPTAYALGPNSRHDIAEFSRKAAPAGALIQKFGDDEKDLALRSLENLQRLGHVTDSRYAVRVVSDRPNGAINPAAAKQASMRNDIYRVLSEMKNVESSEQASVREKKTAGELRSTLRGSVEYAPFWVRLASALCLGIGTMFGYRRVVRTLGERLGRTQLTPAKGASAELVSALLIGTAGFSGLPVSTTHVVTSGIAGTMLMDRGKPGLRQGTVSRILLAWVLTLPVTIGIAAILFYVLER